MNRRMICSLLLAGMVAAATAQSGTKSPYSQFGLGVLSDRSQGAGRGMNGTAQGFREGNQVNALNPASYSAVDSLTMLFDVGMSAQLTNYAEGQKKVNTTTAHFDYVVGEFRVLKGVGVSFGILPYTSVGYDYSTSQYLDATNGTLTETYSGTGGLHELYVGAGWRVLPFLSVGFNAGYLWGGYTRTLTTSSTTYVNSLRRTYSADVSSYELELGAQLHQKVTPKDVAVAGVTYTLGHSLGADATATIANLSTSESTTHTVADALKVPTSVAVGLGWKHGQKWNVGADFGIEKWGSVDFPDFDNATSTYALRSGLLKDRYSVKAGGELLPNAMSRRFLHRVRYRVGAGYATPYYNINGKEGPKELSVSAGVGIPLRNVWEREGRPVLNISAQWCRSSARDLITDNTFRISVGLTFNEKWFAKWKVE